MLSLCDIYSNFHFKMDEQHDWISGSYTENEFVKNMHKSAKRSGRIVKMDVVSSEVLTELCNVFAENTDLLVLRDFGNDIDRVAGVLPFK